MNSPLAERLRTLDYSGTLSVVFARIDADTLAGLLDDVNGRKADLMYFGLRLRAAAEGYPDESRPITSYEELPELARLTGLAEFLVVAENMKREGLIELKLPPLFDINDGAESVAIRATEAGRKRYELLRASIPSTHPVPESPAPATERPECKIGDGPNIDRFTGKGRKR